MAAVTYALLRVLDLTMGLRVGAEQEDEGLDVAEHGESAYALAFCLIWAADSQALISASVAIAVTLTSPISGPRNSCSPLRQACSSSRA